MIIQILNSLPSDSFEFKDRPNTRNILDKNPNESTYTKTHNVITP